MDEYLGTIRMFAGDFAPENWALCEGQLLPTTDYPALYALIGNTYGGDSIKFKLPDLRGRCAMGSSSKYPLGTASGAASQKLSGVNMPTHQHLVPQNTLAGSILIKISDNTGNIEGGKNRAIAHIPANINEEIPHFFENQSEFLENNILVPETIDISELSIKEGESNPSGEAEAKSFEINNPYLGINYLICIQGIYPPQP